MHKVKKKSGLMRSNTEI